MPDLITDNIDLWTSALLTKSTAGRGSNGKLEAYGIKKLRELIFDLAVRGMLAPQDSNDEPASELLKKIEEEKKRLVKNGKIKNTKPQMEIKPEEVLYDLPQGWEWTKLGNVSEVNGGFAFKSSKYTNDGVRVIRISDFDEKGFKDDNIVRYTFSDDLKNFKLDLDNILMAMTGGTVGKSLLVKNLPEPMVVNQRVATIKIMSGIIPEYINGLIRTNLIQKTIHAAKNSTNDNISMGDITGFSVPLPPLAEQHRIVAKVDELMTLCDQLEQQQTDSIEAHQTLVEALPSTLTNVESQQELNEAWTRLANHFDTLFTTEHSIDQLKQTILQLAVMGKLVPQDPNDEPASELLEKVVVEKKQLIKEGKIKRENFSLVLCDDEKPFKIPESWKWVNLGMLLKKITDGTHHSPPNGEIGEFLYISAKNIKDEGVLLSNATYVTKKVHDEIYSRCNPELGDVLYIKDGATTGIATINDLEQPFSMLSSVALLKCPQGLMNTYLLLSLRSPYFYSEMRAGMTGVAITRVTLTKLNDAFISLPPSSEQHRIVAKVNELMALCDTLKARFAEVQTTQIHLADTIVEQAVA